MRLLLMPLQRAAKKSGAAKAKSERYARMLARYATYADAALLPLRCHASELPSAASAAEGCCAMPLLLRHVTAPRCRCCHGLPPCCR